jgi:hypothetical protein
MNVFRSRLLNTAAFVSAAASEGGTQEQKPTVLKEDVGAEDDSGAGGTTDQDQQQNEGGSDGDAGEGGDDQDQQQEEDELAGLTPEQRAKVEAKIAKETTWRDRQIDRLHRQKRQVQEDNRALETIADPARRTAPAAQQQSGKTYTEAEVAQRAAQQVAQDRYDQGCADTDAAGKAAFGGADNWNKITDRLSKIGGVYVEDMQAIIATDHPEMVLHALSSDPDLYERVMALPPARRNNEFVKLGLKAPPKRAAAATEESLRPGEAPPPPRRVQGSGQRVAAQKVDLYDDKVSDDAWYEERNKTRRKKFTNVN